MRQACKHPPQRAGWHTEAQREAYTESMKDEIWFLAFFSDQSNN